MFFHKNRYTKIQVYAIQRLKLQSWPKYLAQSKEIQ